MKLLNLFFLSVQMSCDLVNVVNAAAPLFGPESHEMNGFTTAGLLGALAKVLKTGQIIP